MSVEWRKRGFVPDSDEEDDFDSLNTNKENDGNQVNDANDDVDLTYIPVRTSTSKPEPKDISEQRHREPGQDNDDQEQNDEQDGKASQELISSPEIRKPLSSTPVRKTVAPSTRQSNISTPLANHTPGTRRSARKHGTGSSTTKGNQDKDIWEIPTSPVRITRSSKKSQSHASTPKKTPPTKSPRTRKVQGGQNDTLLNSVRHDHPSSRESSPDELMVLVPSLRKPPANINNNKPNEPVEPAGSDSESVLSSARSNISAPSPDRPRVATDTATDAPEQDLLARILPGLEIPEEFQQPSSQQEPPQEDPPTQDLEDQINVQLSVVQQESVQRRIRSLRTHRPEQMNPYTFENAKYSKLMKDAGIRPVRTRYEEARPKPVDATDESQGQDSFDPNAIRSSPPAEEFLPASRPERRSEKSTSREQTERPQDNSLTIRRKQSTKRRKRSRSGAWHDGTHLVSNDKRAQATDDATPPVRRLDPSIFDFPSSPPHSGTPSSASRTPRASEGFRLPAGLTPPPTTSTAVDSTTITPNVEEPMTVDLADSAASSDDQANSESSGEELETAEEREIRRIQRQTRGVLPASWVRIEAQQRLQKQKASQAGRHATQRADAKGVAKKILRRGGRPARPSQMDFGDNDESDEDSQGTKTPQPEEGNADEALARIVGFENPFGEAEEDDTFEDNRVDYMFPPAAREKRKSLKRAHPKESAHEKEKRLKKARLKKQTRITDASYGSRRTKKTSTRSAPRLGILDAPDVVHKPQEELPQFLRVAARRVRSRRDGGRQSPTRKFLQLGSKRDTADANESLGAWKRGAIPQTKIRRPQSKPRKTRPVANLPSSRPRNAGSTRNSRLTSHFPVADIDSSLDDQTVREQQIDATHFVPAEEPNTSSATAGSKQVEQRGHQWIVQRNTAISSLQRNNPRPSAGSLTERNAGQPASRAMFRQTLTLLNRDYRHRNSSRTFKPSLTLDRYISDTGPTKPTPSHPPQNLPQNKSTPVPERRNLPQLNGTEPTVSHPRRRTLKKHPPTRVNLSLDEFRQDSEQGPQISEDFEILASKTSQSQSNRTSALNIGGGLFNWQRSYPLDFGVLPLRDGTFFHESTFIGSGEFYRSIQVLKRDLDRDAGFASVPFKDQVFKWGAWNDKVSSEMGIVFDMIAENVESLGAAVDSDSISSSMLTSTSQTFRALISYITEKLSFADPIDRAGFLSRSLTLAFKLREPIVTSLANGSSGGGYKEMARIACYNMVFANQICQIATHELVSLSLGEEALDLVRLCAKDTVGSIMSQVGRNEIQRLLDESGESRLLEMGIRDDFPSVEAYVITDHLLCGSGILYNVLKDLEVDVYTGSIIRVQKDIGNLETAWRSLFGHLPLNDIDKQGIYRRELRFKAGHDNWGLVKRLLSPVFESYDLHSTTQTISYNAYCRTLFQRCHRLINLWGWRDCKPILDTLYDFFAQKTLYNLKLEESRGSPSFLDELDQNPSLELRLGEPTFHTFLKIIASGLRFLSKRYEAKKIRNFAWRLLPNHGRMYPKEDPLRHEDLDALRNHHDLLCTLYWVTPTGFRPRLGFIRDLVDPATSHRETCSINLRSWTRLVRFKLSTDEEISELEPFADWHTYFVNELRKQHLLARNEVEAQRKDGDWISEQLIESTISQNQRQIETLLSMALGGLLTAIERAPSLEHAHRLISKTPFESLLSLFNPKVSRVNVVVSEVLAVIVAYTRKDGVALSHTAESSAPVTAHAVEDDSQEYGDWDGIDAVMVQSTIPSEGVEFVQYALHPVVSRLVSNCFGEDHCPEDAILLSTVDCWTSVAQVLVRHGLKRWDDYLDPFGDESWTRLRETVQTRKFSPQFIAMSIGKDPTILSECRMLVMGMWISSLVERSSLLKFQHRLTEALLNGIPEDPLLQNLPFSKDRKLDRYQLSIEEFTQRRISLISSILSNMREHVLKMEISADRDLQIAKREYSEILEQLMTAMKKNYRELGNGAIESAQGAYVEFVHRIIRFLQELTTDIRPVDPFFTDSALFPLPSTDPRYIVAKLKRYEPKLSSKKDLQTLIMFVQSIVERAVLEGQQGHLIEQLHTAMTNSFEAGDVNDKPTLRAVLLRCIFPGYLELAFSTRSAWLLCRPILRSMILVFKDLLFDIDTTDSKCVASVLGIIQAVFYSTYRALRLLSNKPVSALRNPSTLAMLAAFIEMVSSTLVVVDYIDRMTDSAEQIISSIEWFRNFANSALLSVLDDDQFSIDAVETIVPIDSSFERPLGSATSLPTHLVATRGIAFEEHQSCLKNWSTHAGKYYYIRPGHESKEIIIEPQVSFQVEGEGEARRAFVEAVDEFRDRIEKLELLPEEDS